MFNRENFCESPFYPGEHQKPRTERKKENPENEDNQDGRVHNGTLWKPPVFVPREAVSPNIEKLGDGQTVQTHRQSQGETQTMTDFPLLYHLLLLRNFYNTSQQLYSQENRGTSENHNQPLDLSINRNEEYRSAFTKESKKISCDERIKDHEEVEVVHKEDKNKSESVKEFVERKIKEYKKAEENFESFVSKPNLKENDIKRKMKKIKTKYIKINKKLKKLEEIKPKLLKENTVMNDVCIEREVTASLRSEDDACSQQDVEQPNNMSGEEVITRTSCDKEQEEINRNSYDEEQEEVTTRTTDDEEQEERLIVEGARVLLRLESVMYPGRITSILPPDIYGVIVDRERGNRPHVFSREELLSRAVLEQRVGHKSELRVGSRVCVFWSSKMNFLHPALVTGMEEVEEEYVVVTTDDGDTRDLHIDQIRFLPHDFSTSVPEEKESFSLPGFKIVTSPNTEKPRRGVGVARLEKKKEITVTNRRWRWADGGVITSQRSKVLHHRQITDGKEILEVGETAVFLSKFWTRLPYLGRIVDMWETVGAKMKVKINWLYHKEEVNGGSDVKVERAVFESSHFDDNNVQSISHKCNVSAYGETETHDDYCLVGHYDPVQEILTLYSSDQEV